MSHPERSAGDRSIEDAGPRQYTTEDVRSHYSPEKAWGELQGDLLCYSIYRPISFHVARELLNRGVPFTAVTLASGLLALLMLAIAWAGGRHAYLAVVVLGFIYPILDCTDGNMARVLGRTSKLGGIVDGTLDMAYMTILYVSLGLLVKDAGGGLFGGHAVEFAMLVAILVLLNRQTRDNFALNFSDRSTYFRDERPERLSLGDRFLIAVVGLEHGYIFAIAIGGAFGRLDLVLIVIGIYVALIFVGAIAMTFMQAADEDRKASRSDEG